MSDHPYTVKFTQTFDSPPNVHRLLCIRKDGTLTAVSFPSRFATFKDHQTLTVPEWLAVDRGLT